MHRSLCLCGLLITLPILLAAKPADPTREFFVYDKADATIEATLLDNPNDYDASVVSGRDGLWLAWLEFVPGKGDEVWVGCRRGDEWLRRTKVTPEPGAYANPTLTLDATGRLWLSYEVEISGQWDVTVRPQSPEGSFASSGGWTSNRPGPDINHRVAAAADIGVWVVWQSERDGRFEVLASHITDDPNPSLLVVSDATPDKPGAPGRNCWHPDIAVAGDGTAYIVWDSHDGVSYNVYGRARRGQDWTDITALTSGPAFEARARVVASKDGTAWVAWEEGEENWGRVYRAGMISGHIKAFPTDERGSLHRFRKLRVGRLEWHKPGLSLRNLETPLPTPCLDQALARPNAPEGVKALGSFYERPELAIDGGGRLWVFWRQYYTPWLGMEMITHVENGWGVYGRCLTARGWSRLYRASLNQGDGLQRLAVTPCGDGIAAVMTVGRTDRKNLPTTQPGGPPPNASRPRGVACALFADAGKPATEPQLSSAVKLAPAPSSQPAAYESPAAAGRFKLVYGDLHRHTDLSLCFVPTDGTIDDAYRYAIDVARLDFLGVTDHTHDLQWGDPLSQVWWRSRKEVTRHELRPNFWPIFSYERSRTDTDHNVFSLRPDMLRPHSYPLPDFWKELDGDTFTIAHQPVNVKTWQSQDNAHRPLFEIYQGCRDKIVEADAQKALGRGYLMGFIASSDHISTSASYAGVLAEERTRTSIFRALQARRTFAATARISLLVKAGEHWMGEKLTDSTFPALEISAGGTTRIDTLEVLVDGQVEQKFTPAAQEVSLSYTPKPPAPGPHYVYVRLQQADGNHSWSSPIWIDAH